MKDFGQQGILLEAALGTRSIDLLNDKVMQMKLHPTNPKMVVMTGHSKVRSNGQWEDAKDEELDVEPVGMTPQEAMGLLENYREGIPEIIDQIKVTHKKKLTGRSPSNTSTRC
jgi:hypothetical protein